MEQNTFSGDLKSCLAGKKSTPYLLWFLFIGFLIGILAGSIVSIFRITSGYAFAKATQITSQHGDNFFVLVCWFFLAIMAALITGRLMRDPAIRSGGAEWEMAAITRGQPDVCKKILLPKFIGIWLVMAFGVSVGREGPCIQMGAATALGLKNLDIRRLCERRFFVLAGCAAGLAAAFSAPFAGICYVVEVMRQKITRELFTFMLAGSFGVYLSCTLIFDLGVMIPFAKIAGFSLDRFCELIPLGIFCGLVGVAYNYLIHCSLNLYERQKLVPIIYRPLFPFIGAALMLLLYPQLCGEGLGVFPGIEDGAALLSVLWMFLLAKLFFTAFCYGSGIPAGLMVPLLCVGGVAGGIYALAMESLGLLGAGYVQSCMVLGMTAAFTAGELAPVTAIMLVLEMTGAYSLAPEALLCVGCAWLTAKFLHVKPM